MLLITTPINNLSKHYRHFRKVVACIGLKLELYRHFRFRAGHFEDFCHGFGFWHMCHVDRHGPFTLKQLRLSRGNETHTKPYTRPRLFRKTILIEKNICSHAVLNGLNSIKFLEILNSNKTLKIVDV